MATQFVPGGAEGINTLQQQFGASINPYTEALFKSPSLRSFQFQYLLYPKTEQEAINIERIKRFLRYHQYPSTFGGEEILAAAGVELKKVPEKLKNQLGSTTKVNADEAPNNDPDGTKTNPDADGMTGTFFRHPSDFVVRFYEAGGGKNGGGRLASAAYVFPCKITNLDITENAGGNQGWLRGCDGKSYPISSTISIQVKEIQMLTRSQFSALDSSDSNYNDIY